MGVGLHQRSNNNLLTMFQRLMLVPCAVLFFAACADGYPTEDELIINPLELNQAQRLQAMNQLGQDAHPEMKWIYRALPSCIMEVTAKGIESAMQTYSLQMSGVGVDVRFNKTDQVYGVQVQPSEGESLEERTVLLSRAWIDAIEMSNLVRSFQLGCTASAATLPTNKAD